MKPQTRLRRRPASRAGEKLFPRAALALILFALSACPSASSQVTLAVHPDYPELAPRSIAVLPFGNMGPDLDATPLVRPIVAERLRYKGYLVPALSEVDQILKENGVMISHDVHMFTPRELGEMLGVDAAMFGIVTDFTTKFAALYASVAVQLRLELVDCRTGETLWQNEQRAARNTALESIFTFLQFHEQPEKALLLITAQNILFAALEDLYPYAEEAAKRTLAPLPPGPRGERAYPWDRDPAALDRSSVKNLIYFSVITTAPR